VPRPQRLLLVGSGEWTGSSFTPGGTNSGESRFSVGALAQVGLRKFGEVGSSPSGPFNFAMNSVSGVLDQGFYEIGIDCRRTSDASSGITVRTPSCRSPRSATAKGRPAKRPGCGSRRCPAHPLRSAVRARRRGGSAAVPILQRGGRLMRLGHYRVTARGASNPETALASSAPGRIRTSGPLLRRQPLCPLSYGGE
jgi:hypothetical protein